MASTYICAKCGARKELAEANQETMCPLCDVPMSETLATPMVMVSPISAPVAPTNPGAGADGPVLKVARKAGRAGASRMINPALATGASRASSTGMVQSTPPSASQVVQPISSQSSKRLPPPGISQRVMPLTPGASLRLQPSANASQSQIVQPVAKASQVVQPVSAPAAATPVPFNVAQAKADAVLQAAIAEAAALKANALSEAAGLKAQALEEAHRQADAAIQEQTRQLLENANQRAAETKVQAQRLLEEASQQSVEIQAQAQASARKVVEQAQGQLLEAQAQAQALIADAQQRGATEAIAAAAETKAVIEAEMATLKESTEKRVANELRQAEEEAMRIRREAAMAAEELLAQVKADPKRELISLAESPAQEAKEQAAAQSLPKAGNEAATEATAKRVITANVGKAGFKSGLRKGVPSVAPRPVIYDEAAGLSEAAKADLNARKLSATEANRRETKYLMFGLAFSCTVLAFLLLLLVLSPSAGIMKTAGWLMVMVDLGYFGFMISVIWNHYRQGVDAKARHAARKASAAQGASVPASSAQIPITNPVVTEQPEDAAAAKKSAAELPEDVVPQKGEENKLVPTVEAERAESDSATAANTDVSKK